MAALKDTRHEAFAWACAGGLNRSAALAAAGFKPASLSAFGDWSKMPAGSQRSGG